MTPPLNMARGNVLVDVSGLCLSNDDRERLRQPATGGVVLFAENFQTREQLSALVAEIQAIRSPRLFVAVDQEGGRVQRFREEFVRLPAARRFGDIYDSDPEHGQRLAEIGGWVMASEVRAIGIDTSFAPVFDVASVASTVIGDRAFHTQTAAVTDLALAFARGMRRAGMATVAKHFPGHGGVAADSHIQSPIDKRGVDEISKTDLAPYRAAVATGLLDGVMTNHVCFSSVDNEIATFSSNWLGDVLRRDLKFKGVVFTDDLHMAGVADHAIPKERARRALTAGCDVLLMCRDSMAADEMLASVELFTNDNLYEQLRRDPLSAFVAEAPMAVEHPQTQSPARWAAALDALAQINDSE